MVNFKFVLFGQSVQLLPIAVYAAVTSRGVPRPNLLLVQLIYIYCLVDLRWSSSPKIIY